jgi:hypothetical protein
MEALQAWVAQDAGTGAKLTIGCFRSFSSEIRSVGEGQVEVFEPRTFTALKETR